MWFVGAVWLYFYRIFITDYQVGILDAFAFAIGLLAEVPSGALADKFGRDKLTKLGQILAGAGLIIQGFGGSFAAFFVGQSITMIGVAFASGADEALFFQKLNFNKDSADWRKLVTRGSQLALFGSLIALIMGGLAHHINPRIPWFFTGILFTGAALIIWNLKDDRPRAVRQAFLPEFKDYLADIKKGFGQFRLPKLWVYVPIILTVQGLFYTVGWGLLRLVLLDRFYFSPFWGSVAMAACSLITVGILVVLHRYAEELSERHVITLVSLAAAASLLLALADIGMWGFIVILVLYAGERVLYPFMSEVLNDHAPEEQRATVLSVASFLRTLPYVALAPIIGYLSTRGSLEYFLVLWPVLICLAVLFYLSVRRKDALIKIAV